MDNNQNASHDSLTYGKLAELIAGMTDEQKAANVVVGDLSISEYYPAELVFTEGNDVLDNGHPVISALDEYFHGQS